MAGGGWGSAQEPGEGRGPAGGWGWGRARSCGCPSLAVNMLSSSQAPASPLSKAGLRVPRTRARSAVWFVRPPACSRRAQQATPTLHCRPRPPSPPWGGECCGQGGPPGAGGSELGLSLCSQSRCSCESEDSHQKVEAGSQACTRVYQTQPPRTRAAWQPVVLLLPRPCRNLAPLRDSHRQVCLPLACGTSRTGSARRCRGWR